MDDRQLALLLSALALACIVAALLGRRAGDAPRDLRLMLAGGAACGGLGLVFLSL